MFIINSVFGWDYQVFDIKSGSHYAIYGKYLSLLLPRSLSIQLTYSILTNTFHNTFPVAISFH